MAGNDATDVERADVDAERCDIPNLSTPREPDMVQNICMATFTNTFLIPGGRRTHACALPAPG